VFLYFIFWGKKIAGVVGGASLSMQKMTGYGGGLDLLEEQELALAELNELNESSEIKRC
jgi:hypothetical protein